MVIELDYTRILNECLAVSHRETEELEPEARFRIQAGSENLNELAHWIDRGASYLKLRCARFLVASYETYKDDQQVTPETYVFEFAFAQRRLDNKAAPLTSAMHSFLVDYALSSHYTAVAADELTKKHAQLTLEAERTIETLLYTKQPPIV